MSSRMCFEIGWNKVISSFSTIYNISVDSLGQAIYFMKLNASINSASA